MTSRVHREQTISDAFETGQKVAAVEPPLRRVAAERLVLVSTGAADWVAGSGEAVPVEGGCRIHAREISSSAAPAGDLLMTGAVPKRGGEDRAGEATAPAAGRLRPSGP